MNLYHSNEYFKNLGYQNSFNSTFFEPALQRGWPPWKVKSCYGDNTNFKMFGPASVQLFFNFFIRGNTER